LDGTEAGYREMAKNTEQAAKNDTTAKDADLGGKFQISRGKEFAADVKKEFNKIAWPQKKQTMASTLVVVVMVILISFYLGIVDLVLGKIIGLFLK
jgi:preprotein translocase subunit SecE